jgi:hypothetical protein
MLIDPNERRVEVEALKSVAIRRRQISRRELGSADDNRAEKSFSLRAFDIVHTEGWR